MSGGPWIRALGAGVLAGLVAALLMTLVMALLRLVLGIPLPVELSGDRIIPNIPLDVLLLMLGLFATLFGGLDNWTFGELIEAAKRIGLLSGFGGLLVVGALGALLYAVVTERVRARDPGRTRRLGRGGSLVAVVVGLIWLVSVGMLWPVLGSNYRGLPPGQASFTTALGLLLSYAIYGVTLVLAHRAIMGRRSPERPVPVGKLFGRRAFLVGAGGAILALAAGDMIRRIYDRSTLSYDGTEYLGPGIQPVTPNDSFYVVTKNIVDPDVEKAAWRLQISGLVDRPHTYGFEELAALPSAEQETTLECISNPIGGGLMSNAVWRGVPLRTLLEAAGPKSEALEVFFHAADGYTHSASLEKAMEETTLVAYEMNGAPLPDRHGYPARILVPGYFGEAHVKWVTCIELLDRPLEGEGYYGKIGSRPRFVPTTSRIDHPTPGQTFNLASAVTIPLKGVAFAGDRGISRVEVSFDDGQSWQAAKLDYPGTRLSWALWSHDWRPDGPGEHRLAVRATDGSGTVQTSEERSIISARGATGYHRATISVEA